MFSSNLRHEEEIAVGCATVPPFKPERMAEMGLRYLHAWAIKQLDWQRMILLTIGGNAVTSARQYARLPLKALILNNLAVVAQLLISGPI